MIEYYGHLNDCHKSWLHKGFLFCSFWDPSAFFNINCVWIYVDVDVIYSCNIYSKEKINITKFNVSIFCINVYLWYTKINTLHKKVYSILQNIYTMGGFIPNAICSRQTCNGRRHSWTDNETTVVVQIFILLHMYHKGFSFFTLFLDS